MKKKIPPEAFAFYLALGVGRSYQAVAERFSVSKRAVAFCAEREGWQKKLSEEEAKARERAEKQAAESVEAANEKHFKVLRFIQGKAIETLKSMPLDTASEAVKAYLTSLDKERQLRGDPADQNASRLEEITRQEIRTLLTTRPVGTNGPDDY